MALLEEKALLSELEKSKLRPCYFLVGQDAGKADFFLARIQELLKKSGPCTPERFYADETVPSVFADSFQNAPLWMGKRFVVVKRLEKWPAKDQEQFLAVLKQEDWAAGQVCLVVVLEKVDGRTKFAQELGKQEFISQVVFKPLVPEDWGHWLHHLAHARQLKLSTSAKEILRDAGIASVADMDQALGMVDLHTPEGQAVEPEHLKKVQWVTGPESVFELTEAVLARQYKRAAETLLVLERQGEEVLPLLALLARQFRLMFQVVALRKGGKSDQTISSEMRLYPRQAKAILEGARQRPAAHVIKGLESLAQADKTLKSTREPQFQVLQRLLLDLTR